MKKTLPLIAVGLLLAATPAYADKVHDWHDLDKVHTEVLRALDHMHKAPRLPITMTWAVMRPRPKLYSEMLRPNSNKALSSSSMTKPRNNQCFRRLHNVQDRAARRLLGLIPGS